MKVSDAREWSAGRILLVTDGGLRIYEDSSGTFFPGPVGAPAAKLTQACRDSRGRLWVGGKGLWVLEDGRFRSLNDSLPMMGLATVAALEADPEHPGGVIVSLGSRGVVHVQAD